MKEAMCPICAKSIRSDADEKEFCTLCGMGIEDPLTCCRLGSDDGRVLFFCCPTCLSRYLTEIRGAAELD